MNSLSQRKSPRLQGYNYAHAGAYFVTICTHRRAHLFGQIRNGMIELNTAGAVAWDHWYALPDHHVGIELDAFVVMPNHIHGIIALVGTGPALSEEMTVSTDADNAGVVPTLGTVIGSYKSGVTRRIRVQLSNPDLCVWQGRYYDHIIRDEQDLNRIRAYIALNPARWLEDFLFAP